MKVFIGIFFVVNLMTAVFCLFTKKILIFWVLLELKFYSTLPLILYYTRSMPATLIFFVIKSVSSLAMIFGFVGGWSMIWLGLFIFLKLGVLYPFFWFPLILKSSSWLIYPVLLLSKKLPPLVLMVLLKMESNLWLCSVAVFSFFSSSVLLLKMKFDTKNFVALSSVSQTSLMFILSKELSFLIVYFLFYSMTLLSLVYSQVSAKMTFTPLLMAFFFLAQSGFPPSMIFFIKMLLLGSMKYSLVLLLVLGLYVNLLGYLKISFFLLNSISWHSISSQVTNLSMVFLIFFLSSIFLVVF